MQDDSGVTSVGAPARQIAGYVGGVAEAIDILGAAWRGDWSDFDGRTLRAQLGDLAAALRSGQPFDVDRWCAAIGACRECRCWTDYCTHSDSPGEA